MADRQIGRWANSEGDEEEANGKSEGLGAGQGAQAGVCLVVVKLFGFCLGMSKALTFCGVLRGVW